MMNFIHLYLIVSSLLFVNPGSTPGINKISTGQQPQVNIDQHGIIRLIFGRKDSIFCLTSFDQGKSFSQDDLVGTVPQMHLGMARGPQLACSKNLSVITAMDQKGNIHYFILKNGKNEKWHNKGFVNDTKFSAPEGLMNIAADANDHFYAVWLDTRIGKKNNIYFSSFSANDNNWHPNKLVYKSPDLHVCECCRPSIAVHGSNIAIMYRNWLEGSRDLYLIQSVNKGKTFSTAQKLGSGTWKLNGCPMDGGGISYAADNSIHTTWQRKGKIYFCKPGTDEVEIGTGRDCSITQSYTKEIVSYSEGGILKYKQVASGKEVIVGKGSYLKTLLLKNSNLLCVWEDDKIINKRIISQ